MVQNNKKFISKMALFLAHLQIELWRMRGEREGIE